MVVGYEFYEKKMHFIETHHHYPPLIKHDECAMIELHRDLIFREQQHIFPTDFAWGKSIDITLANKAEAKVLNPTYRVFHSILHSCVVDSLAQRGQIEIRQLHELAQAQATYSADIDWEEMLQYAKEHNVHKQFHANLYAAHKFMKFRNSEDMQDLHVMNSALQYARVCSKLKHSWFDTLDTRIVRRIRPKSNSQHDTVPD